MILVTAATAPVGRSIVEQLVAAGREVRALTRDMAKAGLPAGAEVVAGDLSDPASLSAAFKDVSAVFLLAAVPGFAPAFLKAAKQAGVRRIVFQSSGAVDDDADVQLKAGDVVRGPYAQAAGSPIHSADFAAVTIAALTEEQHAGKIYHLTGSQSLTHIEQIKLIGEALGRPLRYEELEPALARRAISPYAPAEVLFATWENHIHTPAPVTDTVERLTGKPPRSVAEWAADYAAHHRS